MLEVNGGRVVLYPGGYDDYEGTRLARVAEATNDTRERATPSNPRGGVPEPAPARGGSAVAAAAPPKPRQERARQNAGRRKERELARLESDIAERERRLRELEALLADPELYHDAPRSKGIVAEYERVRSELESLWERLAELG